MYVSLQSNRVHIFCGNNLKLLKRSKTTCLISARYKWKWLYPTLVTVPWMHKWVIYILYSIKLKPHIINHHFSIISLGLIKEPTTDYMTVLTLNQLHNSSNAIWEYFHDCIVLATRESKGQICICTSFFCNYMKYKWIPWKAILFKYISYTSINRCWFKQMSFHFLAIINKQTWLHLSQHKKHNIKGMQMRCQW